MMDYPATEETIVMIITLLRCHKIESSNTDAN
jgi:hypothetical protein